MNSHLIFRHKPTIVCRKNDRWSKNDERRTTSEESAAKWKGAGDNFVEGRHWEDKREVDTDYKFSGGDVRQVIVLWCQLSYYAVCMVGMRKLSVTF